jgi:hypothetical protein
MSDALRMGHGDRRDCGMRAKTSGASMAMAYPLAAARVDACILEYRSGGRALDA